MTRGDTSQLCSGGFASGTGQSAVPHRRPHRPRTERAAGTPRCTGMCWGAGLGMAPPLGGPALAHGRRARGAGVFCRGRRLAVSGSPRSPLAVAATMYLCRAASQVLAARLSRAPSAASRLKQRGTRGPPRSSTRGPGRGQGDSAGRGGTGGDASASARPGGRVKVAGRGLRRGARGAAAVGARCGRWRGPLQRAAAGPRRVTGRRQPVRLLGHRSPPPLGTGWPPAPEPPADSACLRAAGPCPWEKRPQCGRVHLRSWELSGCRSGVTPSRSRGTAVCFASIS